jgi:hypothetical protein
MSSTTTPSPPPAPSSSSPAPASKAPAQAESNVQRPETIPAGPAVHYARDGETDNGGE